jgi:Vacuolar sorting-associated protein 13, N-terminal
MKNIQINLNGLHIRYEDTYSVPGKLLSAGVMIKSFSMSVSLYAVDVIVSLLRAVSISLVYNAYAVPD